MDFDAAWDTGRSLRRSAGRRLAFQAGHCQKSPRRAQEDAQIDNDCQLHNAVLTRSNKFSTIRDNKKQKQEKKNSQGYIFLYLSLYFSLST